MKIYLPFKTIPVWFPWKLILKTLGLQTYIQFKGFCYLSK